MANNFFKKLKKFVSKHQVPLLFLASRAFILLFPPPYYSDVSHDYERYANMWWYGLPPYLKHYYEYPPATIPLLIVPLLLDLHGIGRYYLNYRLQIFLIDALLFAFILKALKRLKFKKRSKNLSILFYIAAPVIAKNFFYEGLDLTFAGILTIGIISILLYSQKKLIRRILFWLLFWLSTSIKFMSLPLVAPFFYLKKLSFKKELLSFLLAFLIIWGAPLAIFRSSLSVSFVFHLKRPLKYASFPSFLVETANYFTQTEVRIEEAPDFQLVGPVSKFITQTVAIVFPLSILFISLYFIVAILKNSPKDSFKTLLKRVLFLEKIKLDHLDPFVFSLKVCLIFIFTLFSTGKIFSQPFHIWYIPLIALFPFKSIKKKLTFMGLATWLLIKDTTPWVVLNGNKFFIKPIKVNFISSLMRFIPMFILLFLSFKLPNKTKVKN